MRAFLSRVILSLSNAPQLVAKIIRRLGVGARPAHEAAALRVFLGYFRLQLTGCTMSGEGDWGVHVRSRPPAFFQISLPELFHAARGGCTEGFIAPGGRLHDADSGEVHLGSLGRGVVSRRLTQQVLREASQTVLGPCPAFKRGDGRCRLFAVWGRRPARTSDCVSLAYLSVALNTTCQTLK